MPALRGHHLICLHFFGGEGYDQKFIENLTDVLKAMPHHNIDVLHGADDVCNKCPNLRQGECSYTEGADAEIREMDNIALKLLNLSGGSVVRWDDVRKRIPEIFQVWYTEYCNSCGWKKACEQHNLYRSLSGTLNS